MGSTSATVARVARVVVGVLLAAGIAPSAALATKDEFDAPSNSTARRRLQPGSGPSCPAGMFDMTDGNWNWWQCGHGCAGGRYTDVWCSVWKSTSVSGAPKKPFLDDDAAVLAPSSGDEPTSPRHRAGVASMAWRTTRRFSTNAP